MWSYIIGSKFVSESYAELELVIISGLHFLSGNN